MEIDPELRKALIQKKNPFDPPYIQVRHYILKWLKEKEIPISPYVNPDKLEESIIIYWHNVKELGMQIIEEIDKSEILFIENYCTDEKIKPETRMVLAIDEDFLWFSATISVEFSRMFVITNPYFPHKVAKFAFPIEFDIERQSYVLATPFRLIRVLRWLYDPAKAKEWPEYLKEVQALGAKYKPISAPKRGGKEGAPADNREALFGRNYAIISDKMFISSSTHIEPTLKKLYSGAITAIRNRGRVPGDLRVEHTLYRVAGKDVFRVFNLTDYEIIPRDPKTRETIIPVKLRCELIAATMLLLLGVDSSKYITYLITSAYPLQNVKLGDLVKPNNWYIGTVYPYDDYIKEKQLETIRRKRAKK